MWLARTRDSVLVCRHVDLGHFSFVRANERANNKVLHEWLECNFRWRCCYPSSAIASFVTLPSTLIYLCTVSAKMKTCSLWNLLVAQRWVGRRIIHMIRWIYGKFDPMIKCTRIYIGYHIFEFSFRWNKMRQWLNVVVSRTEEICFSAFHFTTRQMSMLLRRWMDFWSILGKPLPKIDWKSFSRWQAKFFFFFIFLDQRCKDV